MAAPTCVLLLAGSLSAAQSCWSVILGCWNGLHQRTDLPFAENKPGGVKVWAGLEFPRYLDVGS